MFKIVIACTHTRKHIQAQTPAIFIILKPYSVLSRLKRIPGMTSVHWVVAPVGVGCDKADLWWLPLLVRAEPAERPFSWKGKCYVKVGVELPGGL